MPFVELLRKAYVKIFMRYDTLNCTDYIRSDWMTFDAG
jgi:hypothetical protein